MSSTDFVKITRFEEALELARRIVAAFGKSYELNFSLKVSFDVELTKTAQLPDVESLAEDFQKFERPKRLHLSHGEFITEKGLPYIVDELRNKHTSNRAVMSLISQKDIIGKGDQPIPSFMVLQFGLEGDELY